MYLSKYCYCLTRTSMRGGGSLPEIMWEVSREQDGLGTNERRSAHVAAENHSILMGVKFESITEKMNLSYFKFLQSVHFLYQRTPFIIQTECTFLISTYIKWASPACFGACVPSSGRTQCPFLGTKCYCVDAIYTSIALVCSSSVAESLYLEGTPVLVCSIGCDMTHVRNTWIQSTSDCDIHCRTEHSATLTDVSTAKHINNFYYIYFLLNDKCF
jgi:hypothetical protein